MSSRQNQGPNSKLKDRNWPGEDFEVYGLAQMPSRACMTSKSLVAPTSILY